MSLFLRFRSFLFVRFYSLFSFVFLFCTFFSLSLLLLCQNMPSIHDSVFILYLYFVSYRVFLNSFFFLIFLLYYFLSTFYISPFSYISFECHYVLVFSFAILFIYLFFYLIFPLYNQLFYFLVSFPFPCFIFFYPLVFLHFIFSSSPSLTISSLLFFSSTSQLSYHLFTYLFYTCFLLS